MEAQRATPAQQAAMMRGARENKQQAVIVKEFHGAIREVARNKAMEVVQGLEKAATRAVEKMESHIESANPEISFKASAFVIDHIIGKATQKSFVRKEVVNIDVVAD